MSGRKSENEAIESCYVYLSNIYFIGKPTRRTGGEGRIAGREEWGGRWIWVYLYLVEGWEGFHLTCEWDLDVWRDVLWWCFGEMEESSYIAGWNTNVMPTMFNHWVILLARQHAVTQQRTNARDCLLELSWTPFAQPSWMPLYSCTLKSMLAVTKKEPVRRQQPFDQPTALQNSASIIPLEQKQQSVIPNGEYKGDTYTWGFEILQYW